ncbi:bifunctional glutamate N-acetyltransferase/amino-acid acetyltransferase ArgJ [soil metagenome]
MAELHLLSPKGFRAGAVHAGIKSKQTPDVGLLVCDRLATAAAVFTTNMVFAAPVKIGRENIAGGKLRAIVVNSGNANACTGKQGEKDGRAMCALAAAAIGCDAGDVLPSSTGIIGHLLPMEKVRNGITHAYLALGDSVEHAHQFAAAILTTDLKRKAAAARFKIGKEFVALAGVCKGSGMIGPRMGPPHATMLAYLTTDAKIPARVLQKQLNAASDASFNAVTVDDHTSTNDTAAILASGLGAAIDSKKSLDSFTKAMNEVCQSLAYQIAADGEGATKVVKIVISSAASLDDARAIARAIANSPLVKCAMHGNDPNWGRIVSAAGLCGAKFDPDRAVLKLQGTPVFRHGTPLRFDAEKLSKALNSPDVLVDLTCGLGKHAATVWTCDLSKEYVTINADYHT